MVLSMITGNSFCKLCSAEKPKLKGHPFLRMKRLKYNFLSCGQVSSTQKDRKKILLNIDKNDNWSCIPCCYHGNTRKRTLGFAAHVQECGFSSFPLLGNNNDNFLVIHSWLAAQFSNLQVQPSLLIPSLKGCFSWKTPVPQQQKFHSDDLKSVQNLVRSTDWSSSGVQ